MASLVALVNPPDLKGEIGCNRSLLAFSSGPKWEIKKPTQGAEVTAVAVGGRLDLLRCDCTQRLPQCCCWPELPTLLIFLFQPLSVVWRRKENPNDLRDEEDLDHFVVLCIKFALSELSEA